MQVVKRDGSLQEFDSVKIVEAISKAFDACCPNENRQHIENMVLDMHFWDGITIEEIQDIVETVLIENKEVEVAKAYILYRDQRTKERIRRSKLVQAVMRRTEATAVENSNANVDEKSFSGREKEASSDIQKIIALDYTLSPEVANAHRSMLLYQHDMEKTNIGEHNCLFVDFKKLFTDGFVTRNGDIRPPSSYSTACQQVAVIFLIFLIFLAFR